MTLEVHPRGCSFALLLDMLIRSLAALPLLLTFSCAFSRRIASDAVDYNKSVESAQNKVLLLNVVRASLGRPVYFTDFSQIRGNLKGGFDGELKTPFGGDAKNDCLATSKGSYASNPTFDLAVLASEEFMRGISTPITPDTFQYFLSQGWSRKLLLLLLSSRCSLRTAIRSWSRSSLVFRPSKSRNPWAPCRSCNPAKSPRGWFDSAFKGFGSAVAPPIPSP